MIEIELVLLMFASKDDVRRGVNDLCLRRARQRCVESNDIYVCISARSLEIEQLL